MPNAYVIRNPVSFRVHVPRVTDRFGSDRYLFLFCAKPDMMHDTWYRSPGSNRNCSGRDGNDRF